MNQREQLRALLLERSVRTGDFVLASGARSDFYVDARRTTMSGEGQRLIGILGLAALEQAGWNPVAIGGLTLGADPVAYAIAHASAVAGRRIDAFTVRKEIKAHGTGRRIEGGFDPGIDVVVIDDVVTSADSALRAVEVIRAEGGRVLGVLSVVDRGEGGRERLQEAGIPLVALFTARELGRLS